MRSGVAAGVPYVAEPPETPRPEAPVVVVWHLMDPPRTERAMAAAIPLAGLDAWRVYLALPGMSSRGPADDPYAVFRPLMEDPVRKGFGLIGDEATAEFPAVYGALRDQLGFGAGPFAVVGGSMGSSVAQLVLLEAAARAGLRAEAAVLLSPVPQLRALVDSLGREAGRRYPWDDDTANVAARMDFPARAPEFAALGRPPVRIVVGAEDDVDQTLRPCELLEAALVRAYGDGSRVERDVIPGMGHALAEEPGLEPAPQNGYAEAADALAVEWLRRWLPGAVPGR